MSRLKNSFSYIGNGLITGKECSVTVNPKEQGYGLFFTDQKSGKSFSANPTSIIDTSHAVTIGDTTCQIRLIEHLMAVLALHKISDAEIMVDGPEVPIADGSGKIYHDLIQNTGIEATTADTNNTKLLQPVTFTHKHTRIVALPADHFQVTYAVNFPKSGFEHTWYRWSSLENKLEDIISARTFGYTKDLPTYQAIGLAMGVTKENTIGINEDGTLTTELRYPDEPVRHKVLDLIGDLFLCGISPLQIKAHVIAIECGHFQHVALAKLLKESINHCI